MKKSDFWQNIWISVKVRKPSKDGDKYVLIWNYGWKEPMIQTSLIAWRGAIAMERGEVDMSADRKYSHWCYIYPPVDK